MCRVIGSWLSGYEPYRASVERSIRTFNSAATNASELWDDVQIVWLDIRMMCRCPSSRGSGLTFLLDEYQINFAKERNYGKETINILLTCTRCTSHNFISEQYPQTVAFHLK